MDEFQNSGAPFQESPIPESEYYSRATILSAIYVEGGLAILAFAIGYFVRFSPVRTLHGSFHDVFLALAATFPILVLFVLMNRSRWSAFRKIRYLVNLFVKAFFRKCSHLQVILICVLAGIGEELFFRGLVHDGIAQGIGGTNGLILGILVSSLLFAGGHLITWTYGIITFFISIYFSLLFVYSGNILVPIIAHGVYDYCVIHFLLKNSIKK